MTVILVTLFILCCGCGRTTSATTPTPQDTNTIYGFPEEFPDAEDMAIPDVALEWQERNAPIYLKDDFFQKYTRKIGDTEHIDFAKAMESIEVDTKFDRETGIITITPKRELGPVMFRFTLYCMSFEELQIYACCEYLFEFMHTNDNPDKWLCFFSEGEPPADDTEFYIIDVDGEEFWLTDNVFYEVNSTICTMLMMGKDWNPEDFVQMNAATL